MATPIKLTYSVLTTGWWSALTDGLVKSAKIDLEWKKVVPSPMMYRAMVRNLEFDICEIAMTTFLSAIYHGVPITGIPVFTGRALFMDEIVYNIKSGIKEAKDLAGKRVGQRSYTASNPSETRALLKSEFGVDPNSITWVVNEDPHVAQYKEPSNVVYAPNGRTLAEMLNAGEIDAIIRDGDGIATVDLRGDLRIMMDREERMAVGERHYRRTGNYRIGHSWAVKDDVLEAHPWIAPEVFRIATEAKRLYLDKLHTDGPSGPRDEEVLRSERIIGGDPLPFGVKKNRKDLEAWMEMCTEQHLLPAPLPVERLFASNTLDLEG